MVRTDRMRLVFAYAATVAAALCSMLADVAIFWRDWIEAFTGWAPGYGTAVSGDHMLRWPNRFTGCPHGDLQLPQLCWLKAV